MLLRTTNAKLTNLAGEPVDFRQAVQCCGFEDPTQPDGWNNDLPGVENHYWPLIGSDAMDYFGGYRFNAFHFRLGPFYGDAEHESAWTGIGGAYVGGPGSSFNPAFYSKVEEFLAHAASKSWWVEVNVVDTWYCKRAQWGDQQIPWSQEAINSCGRVPGNAEVEAFIRQNVRSFTKFGNVIWLIDNEGSEIQGAKREWFTWVRDVIRDEESKHPSGHVHLIGTNSDFTDIADYVATHAREALTVPVDGRWTLNNERNPEFSPEQEASNFRLARDAGLSYAYWRAEQNTEKMIRTLELFRDVVDGTAPVGCFPPGEDDPKWVEPPTPGGGEMRDAVNAAKGKVGERCGTDHSGSLATLDLLGQQLRADGFCAGRMTDSVFIKRSDGRWEEYHAVSFATGCWSQDPAQNPKNTWTYSGSSASACPDPQPPDLESWVVKIHNQGPNWTVVDATPFVKDTVYCNAFGFPGPRCLVRPEDDPNRGSCELIAVGIPTWTGPGEVVPGNPYQYRVRRGTSGTATVCGKGGVCESISVPA
jgi:hypothetical protein